ncbi:MAG: portal protein [Planctomycetota bacterium]|jgi:hypothetical protein
MARKKQKPTDDEVQGIVSRLLEDATNFAKEQLDEDRSRATDYYMGRPFGNEEDGRSKIVVPEVRNVVQAMLPSLMRVFMGPEQVNEYKPRSAEDVPMAKQATDYVNYVFMDDNPGFSILHSAFKDALVRRLGIVKWWWEEESIEYAVTLTGLSEEQLQLLDADSAVELEVISVEAETGLVEAKVSYIQEGRVRCASVPPEELLFNRTARNRDQAIMMAHRRYMPVSDAVAMGLGDEDELMTVARQRSSFADESQFELSQVRRFDRGHSVPDDEADASQRYILVCEAYPYLDLDGHGVSQLYRVHTVGEGYEIIGEPEAVSHRPFALFCPDPEPHTLVGLSAADYVMDIQEIKTAVQRGILDSLNQSIHNRTEVVEGMVNLADALNTEMGAIVRTRAPGMLREIRHSFVGGEALAVMQYLDEDKENRTGISKAAAGLDADALQSSTKAAVAATLSAAQQKIEMVARVFAETGMKQLFQGLLMTITEHQERSRVVRLLNQYVEVDPRSWDASMDVKCNLALGAGTTEEKLSALLQILSKQEQYFQMLGPANPLVKMSQIRHTLGRMIEMIGFPDAAAFFAEIDPEQEKRMEEAAAQAGGGQEQDPQQAAYVMGEQIKAQARLQEQQMESALKERELALKREEIQLTDDRERDKAATAAAVQLQGFQMQYDAKVNEAQLKADTDRMRAQLQAGNKKGARRIAVNRDESGNIISAEVEESEG